MTLVRWSKLLNLDINVKHRLIFLTFPGSAVSFTCNHWADARGRNVFVGRQFFMGLVFFYILWLEAQHPFFADQGWLFIKQPWKKREHLLSGVKGRFISWPVSQREWLPPGHRDEVGLRAAIVKDWGFLTSGFLSSSAARCVSCVTWPSSRDSGDGAWRNHCQEVVFIWLALLRKVIKCPLSLTQGALFFCQHPWNGGSLTC